MRALHPTITPWTRTMLMPAWPSFPRRRRAVYSPRRSLSSVPSFASPLPSLFCPGGRLADHRARMARLRTVQPSDYPLSPFKMKFEPPLFHPNGAPPSITGAVLSDAGSLTDPRDWVAWCSISGWKRVHIDPACAGRRSEHVRVRVRAVESRAERREGAAERYLHARRCVTPSTIPGCPGQFAMGGDRSGHQVDNAARRTQSGERCQY